MYSDLDDIGSMKTVCVCVCVVRYYKSFVIYLNFNSFRFWRMKSILSFLSDIGFSFWVDYLKFPSSSNDLIRLSKEEPSAANTKRKRDIFQQYLLPSIFFSLSFKIQVNKRNVGNFKWLEFFSIHWLRDALVRCSLLGVGMGFPCLAQWAS